MSENNKKRFSITAIHTAIKGFAPAVLVAIIGSSVALGAPLPDKGPEVDQPFPGDPRLEPLSNEPFNLADFELFGNGKRLIGRFPDRVNGQQFSNGDLHADLFELFFEDTGLPVGQRPIVEAVPKNTVDPDVGDLTARQFSAIWEMHAVTVDPGYNPADPAQLIDSVEKLLTSTMVREIFQTNIFLNCPVVPLGSTVDPGSPPIKEAFFRGQVIALAPYLSEDGEVNAQVMFKFVDAAGNTLPSASNPHLVVSKIPGDPNYTPIWQIWEVEVADAATALSLTSGKAIKDHVAAQMISADTDGSGLLGENDLIRSTDMRLNCPIVAIENEATGLFEGVPIEDAFALLRNDCSSGPCRFNPDGFKIDLPEAFLPISGKRVKPGQTFLITEINPGGVGIEDADLAIITDGPENPTKFPSITPSLVDGKGNVIPLILKDPYPLIAGPLPSSSGPNSSGDFHRIITSELAAAFPMLPPQFEANFNGLITKGLLDPSWAAGIRPYQDRLALLGRALFELNWLTQQGANENDTLMCFGCHGQPAPGGAATALYNLERPTTDNPLGLDLITRLHPESAYGSGAAELLRNPAAVAADGGTNAHGSAGGSSNGAATIRGFFNGAQNTHFGIQSSEFIVAITSPSPKDPLSLCIDPSLDLDGAAALDCDADGVINESTIGEITAMTTFFHNLPVPDEAQTDEVLRLLFAGQTAEQARESIRRGKQEFRSNDCVGCHKVFHPLSTTIINEGGPDAAEGSFTFPLRVSHHHADKTDVDHGDADFVGQPGIRTLGNYRKSDVGPALKSEGTGGSSVMKNAELWDIGSVFPYGRSGTFGADLRAVIEAHGGDASSAISSFDSLSNSLQQDIINFLSAQLILGKLGEGSGGEDPRPVELVLGQLDSDDDVDRNDIRIVYAARNQPAACQHDPRDVNHDGTITIGDGRALVRLCTRRRCATE